MGRKRVVKTYEDTSASGDRTPIEGHRYFVRVELVSLKVEDEADIVGRGSELYFKVGGKGVFKIAKRSPDRGFIKLDPKEIFIPPDGMDLYTAFVEQKGGGSVEIPFNIYDQDLTKDDKLIETDLSVTLGQNKDYVAFLENGIKVKIAVSANQTRY